MQKSYWTIQTYELASEYMIFSIDPLREQPIQIDASVGHMDLYLANRAYYQNLYRYSYDFSVERAVYIGDYLYVISGEAISSHDMNRSFERISILQFHSWNISPLRKKVSSDVAFFLGVSATYKWKNCWKYGMIV